MTNIFMCSNNEAAYFELWAAVHKTLSKGYYMIKRVVVIIVALRYLQCSRGRMCFCSVYELKKTTSDDVKSDNINVHCTMWKVFPKFKIYMTGMALSLTSLRPLVREFNSCIN